MMSILKKSITLLLIACFLACDDEFTELNKNPNLPTKVPPHSLLVTVQNGLTGPFITTAFDITNKMVNYHETASIKKWDFFLSRRRAGEAWWNAQYGQLTNLLYIYDKAGKGEEDLKGVALVLKSWMYYYATMLYGDLPYSKAGKAQDDINKPPFDPQEKIFQGILADLEEANNLLGTGKIPLRGDGLLGNNEVRWKRFANSLKVRVLIAQSGKIDPSAELQKMMDNPAKYPLMESNKDQPVRGLLGGYPRNKNGLYFVDDVYMGKNFIDKLLEFNDERIKMYAAEAKSPESPTKKYVGIPSGSRTTPGGKASKLPVFVFESLTNGALESIWMQYAELQFLLAEAAEKGWISGGSAVAEKYYNEGIRASYEYQEERLAFGIKQGTVDEKGEKKAIEIEPMTPWEDANYLAQEGVKYQGTTAEKKSLIATQKWLALYNDMESYFSWRRTQLPALEFTDKRPPHRFEYPVNERIFNKENYDNAVAAQGADNWTTKMWVLQ